MMSYFLHFPLLFSASRVLGYLSAWHSQWSVNRYTNINRSNCVPQCRYDKRRHGSTSRAPLGKKKKTKKAPHVVCSDSTAAGGVNERARVRACVRMLWRGGRTRIRYFSPPALLALSFLCHRWVEIICSALVSDYCTAGRAGVAVQLFRDAIVGLNDT